MIGLLDKQYADAFFEKAPVAICIVSPEGRFEHVNNKVVELLGYSKSELLTMKFQQITDPIDLTADLLMVQRIREGEITGYEMNKRYIPKIGEKVWCNLHVRTIYDDNGKIAHFVSYMLPPKNTAIYTRNPAASMPGTSNHKKVIEFIKDFAQKNAKTLFFLALALFFSLWERILENFNFIKTWFK